MRSAVMTALVTGLVAASACALFACRQNEGKPCQTTSDCEKGLVCCFDGVNASSTLGVCKQGPDCTPRLDSSVDAQQPDDAEVIPDAQVIPDAEVVPDAETFLDAAVSQDASP